MKRLTVVVPALPLLLVAIFCICDPAFGRQISPGRYYTWGISNSNLDIPDGSIITEAVLTIHGITNIDENDSDALQVRLLDNLPLDFTAGDNTKDDTFENQGVLLTPVYHDMAPGYEDLVYTFSDLNDESSGLWNVFNPDDPSMTGYSSLLLQLIDYAGNGTPLGFGLDPNGISSYAFDKITLELTVDSFSGPASPYLMTFTTSLIETIGPRNVDEGSTLTFDVITLDPDTVVSAQPLPAGASLSNNTFAWTPGYDQAGTYDIEFGATDGEYEDIETVTLTVNNVPVVTSIQILGPAIVNENSTASYTCTATYDDLSTSAVTATWNENSNYASINNGVLTTGDVLANQQCTITASYENQTDIHNVTITYIPEITALTISGPAQVNENSTVAYTCTATYDDLGTSTVTATWNENSNYAAIDSNGNLATDLVISDQPCQITASYQGRTATYTVTIVNALMPPVLAPIGNKSVDEKKTLAFEVIAAGANGEPITCWAENLPKGATFDGNIFTWRPWYGDAGSYDVTFVASDGYQEDSQTITITVNPVKLASWYERWRKHLGTF